MLPRLFSHKWQHLIGVEHTKGAEIVGIEEKPIYRTCINVGVYVLELAALSKLNVSEYCDIPELFERLQSHAKQTAGYPMYIAMVRYRTSR